MWIASFHGHQKCVQLLTEGGANINVPRKVTVLLRLKTTYLTSVIGSSNYCQSTQCMESGGVWS